MTDFVCEYCGDQFTRYTGPSAKPYRFCSPACRNKARSIEKVPCPICGTLFTPRVNDTANGKTIKKRHCSTVCAQRALIGRPSANPAAHPKDDIDFIRANFPNHTARWIANEMGITLSAVHNLINRNGIRKHGKPTLPRREWTRKYMTDSNPMRVPEIASVTGKKVSDKYWSDTAYRLRCLQSHSVEQRKKASKPELKAKEILSRLGVSFEHQSVIKPNFLVDFKIDKVIIQIDGEYWHGHPRFSPLSDRQVRQIARDKAQDKYLMACGYTVVRIWESEISEDTIRRALLIT